MARWLRSVSFESGTDRDAVTDLAASFMVSPRGDDGALRREIAFISLCIPSGDGHRGSVHGLWQSLCPQICVVPADRGCETKAGPREHSVGSRGWPLLRTNDEPFVQRAAILYLFTRRGVHSHRHELRPLCFAPKCQRQILALNVDAFHLLF